MNDIFRYKFLLDGLHLIPKGRPVTVSLKNPKMNKSGRMIHTCTFTPKKTQDCEKEIKIKLREQMHGREIITSKISMTIFMQIKKGRGDLDNYVKTIKDAMNGIVYSDDKQVKGLNVLLENGDEDCVFIQVEPLQEDKIIKFKEYLDHLLNKTIF